MKQKIVLASQSPRRQELLKLLTEEFEIEAADIDEKSITEKILKGRKRPFRKTAEKLVKKLSRKKAEAVFKNHPDKLVIGADTIVVLKNKIMGKPDNKKEAYQMLKKLSGKTHYVLTGVTIMDKEGIEQFAVCSHIHFGKWNRRMKAAVKRYVGSGKSLDKAGAYGIQEEAGLFVKWIKGDYNNIVGLPVAELDKRIYKRIKG